MEVAALRLVLTLAGAIVWALALEALAAAAAACPVVIARPGMPRGHPVRRG